MVNNKFHAFIAVEKALKIWNFRPLHIVIKDIPKEKYENIIKGTYNRTEKYIKKPSNRRKTLKNYL